MLWLVVVVWGCLLLWLLCLGEGCGRVVEISLFMYLALFFKSLARYQE